MEIYPQSEMFEDRVHSVRMVLLFLQDLLNELPQDKTVTLTSDGCIGLSTILFSCTNSLKSTK